MKLLIALCAVLAVASAGYLPLHGHQVHAIHSAPHHVHVLQVASQPAVPALHPNPVHHHANDHVTRIHYDHSRLPHPHLVGVEHAVHEPVIAPVHGHGHGHGLGLGW